MRGNLAVYNSRLGCMSIGWRDLSFTTDKLEINKNFMRFIYKTVITPLCF